jgi:hypothetical protein
MCVGFHRVLGQAKQFRQFSRVHCDFHLDPPAKKSPDIAPGVTLINKEGEDMNNFIVAPVWEWMS